MAVFAFVSVSATEFGVVIDDPKKQYQDFVVSFFKTNSSMRWVRYSGEWVADANINQVAIHPCMKTWPHLPADLLALYWACRTNTPIYPNVKQVWEVWNEPDFFFARGNADRMAAVLKAAYWGIKAGNSNALVLMPSLAFAPGKYAKELVRNEISSFTDGYNWHFYGWAHDFPAAINRHRRFMEESALPGPEWITEEGYLLLDAGKGDDPVELARQQAFHERMVIEAVAASIDISLAFILTPYLWMDKDMGITDSQVHARPSLVSYLYLAKELTAKQPLFVLKHKFTGERMGLVFRTSDGHWWTALWTPFRYQDFDLPKPRRIHEPSGRDKEVRMEQDGTEFTVELRFPPDQSLAIGLLDPVNIEDLTNATFVVSSRQNLFLRTPPTKFWIKDCVWEKIDAIDQTSRETRDETAGTHGHPRFSMTPSPVVIQMNYDALNAIADKPSQTYRYDPRRPVHASINLHSFSRKPEAGRVTLKLQQEGLKNAFHGKQSDFESASLFTERFITVPPLSKIEIPVTLSPSEINFSNEIAVYPKRTGIIVNWESEEGFRDVSFTWLEVQRKYLAPHFAWPRNLLVEGLSRVGQVSTGQDNPALLKCVLAGVPANASVSVWVPLPERMGLRPDDYVCGEIRIWSATQKAFLEVNLVTSEKEVVRYSDSDPLDRYWKSIACRPDDFTPSLWSRFSDELEIPANRIRFLRLRLFGVKDGDRLELRNFGILRRD